MHRFPGLRVSRTPIGSSPPAAAALRPGRCLGACPPARRKGVVTVSPAFLHVVPRSVQAG